MGKIQPSCDGLEAAVRALVPQRLEASMQFDFVNDRLAPSVESQLTVALRHWRILVRGNADLHLIAQLDSGSLRVTSKLQCVELAQGTATTESGRSYRLCAPPEKDEVLLGLMRRYALREIQSVTGDVSEEVWRAISSGAWPAGMAPLLPGSQ